MEPHSHSFGQERKRPGESRTIIVIAITAATMAIEIAAGLVFGSMALLADGLHMASHAAALSITAAAYIYARRRAHDERFSFGTGKVNALGGFSGAVLLGLFAVVMAWESVLRIIQPVPIQFDRAILVAVLGLVVNGASVFILKHDSHDHGDHSHHDHHHDHNLRSAYLHVLADALTSLLAIGALLTAKYFGALWMDPVMGIVGAMLVTRWSLGLLRTTARVLLDRQGPADVCAQIREDIERDDGTRVCDLHLWSIGPGIWAVEIAVSAVTPRSPQHYKARLPDDAGLVHVIVEVNSAPEHESGHGP